MAVGFTTKLLSIGLTTVSIWGCIGPEVKKSHFDENPNLLIKDYTPAIVETIKENFQTNPTQHSQKYGNAMLALMHQKSPEFAQEMAKVPDIVDGINSKEADALESILEVIKPIQFTPDFYRNLDIGINKILLTVTNPNSEEITWSGKFYRVDEGFGSISVAKAIDLEPSDSIDHIFTNNSNTLNWAAKLPPGDSDSILLHVEYPRDNTMVIKMDGWPLIFIKDDIKKKLRIEHDLENGSKLTLEDANMFGISPVIYGVRDMVMYGGKYKVSSLMEALLQGYVEGHFKKGENPFEEYKGAIPFIKPIWGDMREKDWDTLNELLSKINTADLADYWVDSKIEHILLAGRTRSPTSVFTKNIGDCDDVAYLVSLALTRAGENVFLRRVYNGYGIAHVGLVMKKNGLYHVVVDFSKRVGSENIITSNLKTLKDADTVLGYGKKYKFREYFSPRF